MMKRSRARTHSSIGARMGPAVPPTLVRALRDERATGCNLHSNELRTLDVLLTAKDDESKEEEEVVGRRIHLHNDAGAASPEDGLIPRTLPQLPDLVDLDVSSNLLGGGGGPTPTPPSAGVVAGASLLALCAANLLSLNLSANGLDHDDLARLLSSGAREGDTAAAGVLVLPNLRTLNLSHNELTRLPQSPDSTTSSPTASSPSLLTETCPILSSLSLVGNRIGKLSPLLAELRSLGATLTELALRGPDDENENGGNRACGVEGYEATVLRLLPNLNRLDGRDYSGGEREEVLATAELRMLRLEEGGEADRRGNDDPGDGPPGARGKGGRKLASPGLGKKRGDDDGGATMKKGRKGGTTTTASTLPRRRRTKDPVQVRFSAPADGGIGRRQATTHAAETTSSIRARRRASNEPRGVDLAAVAAMAASDGGGGGTSTSDAAASSPSTVARTRIRMDGLEARLDLLSSIAEDQADATRALLRMKGGSSFLVEDGGETLPPSPQHQHQQENVTFVGEEGAPQQYHAWSRHQHQQQQQEVVEEQHAYQQQGSQNTNVLEQGVVGNRVLVAGGNKRRADAAACGHSVSTTDPASVALHTTAPFPSPLPQVIQQGAQTCLRSSDGVANDDNYAFANTSAESTPSAPDIASAATNSRHRPSAIAAAAAVLLVTLSSPRKRRRRRWAVGRALWRWRHRATELSAAADAAKVARRAARWRRDKLEVRDRVRRCEEAKLEERERRLKWDEERKKLLVEHRLALEAAAKRCDSETAELRERLGRREKELRRMHSQRDDLARDKGVLEGKCKSLGHAVRRGEKERRRLLDDIKKATGAREERVRGDGDDSNRERSRRIKHLENELISLKRVVSEERDARDAAEKRYQLMVAEKGALMEKAKLERLSAYEDELKVSNAKAEKKMNQLSQAFEEAARRAANDRALRDQATEAGREAVALVQEQRNQIRSLQQSVHTLKEDATYSDQEKQKLLNERNDLESMLQQRRIEHEKIGKQIKCKDKEIKNMIAAISQRKKRETELQETARKMKKNLSRIRQERKETEKQRSTIAAAHQDLEAKVSGLENELREVSLKHVPIQKLEDAKEATREWEIRHKEAIEKCQRDVESLRNTICKKDEAIMSVELEKNELQRSYRAKEMALREQCDLEREKVHKRLEESSSEMKEEFHNLEEARVYADQLRMEAEDEAKALANELSAERDSRKLAENEARRLSTSLQKQTSRTKAAIEDLFVTVT